jgi:hypothetical protein
MSKRPSLPRMMCIRCHRQISRTRNRLNGSNMNRVFIHVGEPDAVAIYVVPGFCGVETKFIGHYANNRAIFIVNGFIVEGYAAFEEGNA